MKAASFAALALALAACSDDTSPAIDAAVDAIDAPEGPCGADVQFTGEYVAWTSTTADFMGIFDARFTVTGDATRTATTAPNGRVILCISSTAPSRITATEDDHNPAVFLADPAVFTPTDATFSSRGLRLTQRNAHYVALGEAGFDAARAHVLVEKQGAAVTFALTGAGNAYHHDGTAWSAGATGNMVLFANVPVGTGTATLSATGGTFVGPTAIELVAGTLTVVPTR